MSADVLTRALAYPYALTGKSFVFHNGNVSAFAHRARDELRKDRTPVLAVGSNQSPEQLARKFHGPGWQHVPTERCALEGFDTVYSPHITVYGSIPATLQTSPGTTVTLYVNWLDDAQLERMHETEIGNANYAFCRMGDIRCDMETGDTLDSLYLYVGNRGALTSDSKPIALSEVPAKNRQFPAMNQHAIQKHVHGVLDTTHDLRAHILNVVDNAEERARHTQTLMAESVPFTHSTLHVLVK